MCLGGMGHMAEVGGRGFILSEVGFRGVLVANCFLY